MWKPGLTVFIALVSTATALRFQPCPLLGAAFQQPYNLSTDTTFQTVLHNLTHALNSAISSGSASNIALAPNITSFSIGVFDLDSDLYSFHHTAHPSTLDASSVKSVNDNTIYRIASISKLFTVYLYLVHLPYSIFEHFVTSYLPYLTHLESLCSPTLSPLSCTPWSEITLGSLASHLSGLPRDYGTPSLTSLPSSVGLPPSNLTASELLCQNRSLCAEIPYLSGVAVQHPTDAVYQQPIYSNAGFQILGYVFENITGRKFPETLQRTVFERLGMGNSSVVRPEKPRNAVIPGNMTSSLWDYDAGPQGVAWLGVYSTMRDLGRAGRGMLGSVLVKGSTTRRWLKPVTHTATRDYSVGMPWEIFRNPVGGGRVVDEFTKSGDIGAYHSRLSLMPDYNVGYVILLAGEGDGYLAVEGLKQTVAEVLVEGLERTARVQASEGFEGTYRARDGRSEIVLTADKGLPGVRVERWISQGTDFLGFNAELFGEKEIDVRLYPTALMKKEGPRVKRAYKAVTSFPGIKYTDDTMRQQDCESWVNVDGAPWNEVGIDEFEIETEWGRVVRVLPRALDVVLEKVE